MAIGAIEGPTGSSALWPSSSVLYERMTKVLSVFAERLALRREDLVQRLADGESLAEVAQSQGMARSDAMSLAASQFAWQPGRPAMDPARVQAVASGVLDARATDGVSPAAAMTAAVTGAAPAAATSPQRQTAQQRQAGASPALRPAAQRPVDIDLLGSGPQQLPDPPLLLDGTPQPAPPVLKLPGSGRPEQAPAGAASTQEAVQAYAARAVEVARAKEAASKEADRKEAARKEVMGHDPAATGPAGVAEAARSREAVHAEAARAEAARSRSTQDLPRLRPPRRSAHRPPAAG